MFLCYCKRITGRFPFFCLYTGSIAASIIWGIIIRWVIYDGSMDEYEKVEKEEEERQVFIDAPLCRGRVEGAKEGHLVAWNRRIERWTIITEFAVLSI
jgi:hypothetical protein